MIVTMDALLNATLPLDAAVEFATKSSAPKASVVPTAPVKVMEPLLTVTVKFSGVVLALFTVLEKPIYHYQC